MKSIPAFTLALLMTASVAVAEQPAAAAKNSVTNASLTTSDAAAKTEIQTVGYNQNVCPNCGRVHGNYVQSSRKSDKSMFDRVMDVERRKNKWLLGLIGR